jgi:hypothetical protein
MRAAVDGLLHATKPIDVRLASVKASVQGERRGPHPAGIGDVLRK